MIKDTDAPQDGCLDAETLAAWADAALDARARAAVEAHAADCARCQALLAAVVRAEPPLSAAAAPSRARTLWWLAALTPIAAALVVWFAVPQRVPRQQSQTDVLADQNAPAAAPTAPEPPGQAAAAAAVAAPAEPPAEARLNELANKRQRPAFDAERDVAALEKKAAPAQTANALSAADAIAGAAPAAPPAAAESSLRGQAAVAPARPAMLANPLDSLIVSSNPATRFRILPGGNVQRSADGGATWRVETTGAAVSLTAGASPSPSVCWLIGPNGLVLLSTNGPPWRRLAFPEAVDLRSIAAVDGENATVTTVDGRVFSTTDAGQSWSRAPNP